MHKIFTYWEGERPDYIKSCFKSHCGNVELITPDNVGDYLKDTGLESNWNKLKCVAHKADCIRVAVMNKYGGLYIDADTVILRNPEKILTELLSKNSDFYYMRWNDGRILNGYFVCKPNTDIMSRWLHVINKKLHDIDTRKTLTWTEFGEQILTPLVYGVYKNDCLEINRDTFIPINVDKIPHIFFEDIQPQAFIKENTYTIALNHSFFKDNYPDFVKDIDSVSPYCLIRRILKFADVAPTFDKWVKESIC